MGLFTLVQCRERGLTRLGVVVNAKSRCLATRTSLTATTSPPLCLRNSFVGRSESLVIVDGHCCRCTSFIIPSLNGRFSPPSSRPGRAFTAVHRHTSLSTSPPASAARGLVSPCTHWRRRSHGYFTARRFASTVYATAPCLRSCPSQVDVLS